MQGGFKMSSSLIKSRYFDQDDISVSIKEFGIQLNQAQRSLIQKKLESLYQISPYNSFITLVFIKDHQSEEQGIKTHLSITSPGKIFRTSTKGVNPLSCFIELQRDILFQIEQWKKSRFPQVQILNHPSLVKKQEVL